ncbi:MAG: hypothetical protein KZQ75_03450 [Candidatus Thiodiazotropha sp. (ex Myrtea spinifera)]|nr:hypothetical protein [Candidatus Thiodiazotropha sp. (ex Myrtea spinifera)]MCU7830982.1 hypothetical protein [Candidatus Thiodiazotropha sp. (ex Myrtea sp. 'scaly one' KF741663)]
MVKDNLTEGIKTTLITNISFTRDGREYLVKLNLDDAAIMEGDFVIEVTASVTERNKHKYEESLTLTLDFERMHGAISHKGEPLHEFDLHDLPFPSNINGSESPEGMETGDEGADDPVAEYIEKSIGHHIHEIIEAMPVPDPILGCALKAGISSALGQSLVCNEMVGSDGTKRQRFWRIARCLREHVAGIFTTVLWRAARCMVMLV